MLQGFPVNQVSDLVAQTPQKLLQDIAGEHGIQSSVVAFVNVSGVLPRLE